MHETCLKKSLIMDKDHTTVILHQQIENVQRGNCKIILLI